MFLTENKENAWIQLVNKVTSVFSINLLAFCHECRSLIGYDTRYLVCMYT